MPTFADPVRSPIPPPTANAAPTSARSKPVIAPIASSMITQMMPAITSDQLTQLPTARLLPLHVPRTIASVRLVFNDSSCGAVAERIVETCSNGRRVLVETVVIAGNRACADIALLSDFRVAQIRKVHGLRAFADGAFLEFNKIADARASFQVIVRTKPRKGTNDDAVIEAALR